MELDRDIDVFLANCLWQVIVSIWSQCTIGENDRMLGTSFLDISALSADFIVGRYAKNINFLKCSGVRQLHLKVFNAIQV